MSKRKLSYWRLTALLSIISGLAILLYGIIKILL